MSSHLHLQTLGTVAVTLDGASVDGFATAKEQALLIYLVVTGQPVRREKLQELLWPDMPAASAAHNLRQATYSLRKALTGDSAESPHPHPFIASDRRHLALQPDAAVTSDVGLLRNTLTAVQDHGDSAPHTCPDCLERLEQVAAGYHGDFLDDFYLADSAEFEAWAHATRAALRRQALGALADLADRHLNRRDYTAARRVAEQQLAIEPLGEAALRQLLLALACDGRRSEAVARYEAYCRLLDAELGMAPEARTVDLVRRISSGDHVADPVWQPTVRGYQLQARLGEGTFGVVYRALQPAVNRDVAIKLIRPRYANDPEFIRRFEIEAQTIARLEHPHIVPLYDYWREPDGAFLVMRYCAGGHMQDVVTERGPLPPADVVELVDQVASALDLAHSRGVVHCDLTPTNIVLDETGNAYVTDFSLARRLLLQRGDGDGRDGRPADAYLAPERLAGEALTPQTDIYSLGRIIAYLLTGAAPTATPARVGDRFGRIGPALDHVIATATAPDPADRYPGVRDLADALRHAVGADGRADAATGPRNPYRGLHAFTEADAGVFFGRTAFVDSLLAHLHHSPLLAVVGPSGSGKSSVVNAGLIPALRAGAVPGSDRWFVARMTPGTHPLEELELALLRIAVNPPASLLEPLQRDTRGLLHAVRRVLPDADGARLLLVVDQFEELYTLVADDEHRRHFLDSLTTALEAPRSPLRLVITLRADYYDRPLLHPRLGQRLQDDTRIILPLTTDELRAAVIRPATAAGVTLENGLATRIILDVADEPGALPLLEYALTELFDRRDGDRLTCAAYSAIGGVTGALARRADALVADFDDTGQALARQMLLRLAAPADGGSATRRRVPLAELTALESSADTHTIMPAIVDAFSRARLLTIDRDPVTRAPTVEVAHEALLHAWPRLRVWLDESRTDVVLQRRLAQAAAEWHATGGDPGFLLRGARLNQFAGWSAESPLSLTDAERAYLDASLSARAERVAAEEARRRHALETAQQLAESERQRAVEQSRAAASLRRMALWLGVALAVAALLASAAALAGLRATRAAEAAETARAQAAAQQALAESAEADALAQREEARRQASIGLASQALLEMTGNYPERAVPLALEALEHYPYTWQAEHALGQAVLEQRIERIVPVGDLVSRVAWSPDGSRIAALDIGGTVYIHQAQTGALIATLPDHIAPHAAHRSGIRWSPDGTRLLTFGLVPSARVWDAATGAVIATLAHNARVFNAVWSPDGERVLTVSLDGTARIWDAADGRVLVTWTSVDGSGFFGAAWSPDGEQVAVGSADGRLLVRGAAPGATVRALNAHPGSAVLVVDWSPDGSRLLSAGGDGSAVIWDAAGSAHRVDLTGHTLAILGATWSPDGAHVGAFDANNNLLVWDAATGAVVVDDPSGLTFSDWHDFAWSPDGAQLAVFGSAGGVRLLDVGSGLVARTIHGHRGRIVAVAWSPDGSRLLTGAEDGAFRIWDVSPRAVVIPTDAPAEQIAWSEAYWSPDGSRLLIFDMFAGGTHLRVLDGTTLAELARLETHLHYSSVTWHPEGDRLFGCTAFQAHGEPICTLWQADAWTELWEITGCSLGHFCNGMDWSPDRARMVVAGTNGVARVLDAATGAVLLTKEHGADNPLMAAAFDPAGGRIMTAGLTGVTTLWDSATGEDLLVLPPPPSGIVQQAAWMPDGSAVVVFSNDAVGGRLYDAAGGALRGTFTGHSASVLALDFSRDGTRLLTSSEDGTARVWDVATGTELLRYTWRGPLWTAHYDGADARIAFSLAGGVRVVDVAWGDSAELIHHARACCLIHELTPDERTLFGLPPRP